MLLHPETEPGLVYQCLAGKIEWVLYQVEYSSSAMFKTIFSFQAFWHEIELKFSYAFGQLRLTKRWYTKITAFKLFGIMALEGSDWLIHNIGGNWRHTCGHILR